MRLLRESSFPLDIRSFLCIDIALAKRMSKITIFHQHEPIRINVIGPKITNWGRAVNSAFLSAMKHHDTDLVVALISFSLPIFIASLLRAAGILKPVESSLRLVL